MAGRIYSVGYEGLTVDGLVDRLVGSKVTTLVDVRLNPISRRPGFSRRQLQSSLAAAGIEYVHEKELGNPVDNRVSFQNGDAAKGRKRMRTILSSRSAGALQRVAELAANQRIAILCVERDHERCHRSVITEMAVEHDANIDVLRIL
jgi:uncharacterized protein (DUF488 family)